MKEKILFILLLLLVPTFVLAKDTCNSTDIKIKSIALKDTNGFSEEVEGANINNNVINLNLKLYDVGDSSTYNITIENNSSEEYYFTNDSFKMDTDYIEYQLKNKSEVIPAKSEKEVELRVTYKSRIVGDSYSDIKKLSITLADKPLENPETNANHYIFFIILLVMIPICIHYNKKGLFLLGIFGLITNVHAICTVNLNVEAKIEIENKEAIFLPGKEVNVKMKELAGDDTSVQTYGGYYDHNENIVSIKYHNVRPEDSNKEEKNIVSTIDSPTPIYMWYEDGVIYWWSEDKHPNLNTDSSFMFYLLIKLYDISGLNQFDVSEVTNLVNTFGYDESIADFTPLSNWDTSNVEILLATFYGCSSMTDVDFLLNWDVSNVTKIQQLFHLATGLKDLKGLKNWDVSKVNSMFYMFNGCTSLCTLEGLENWNVSNVTKYDYMFDGNTSLSDASFINDWDIKSTAIFTQMFRNVPTHPEFSKVAGTWNSAGTFIPST